MGLVRLIDALSVGVTSIGRSTVVSREIIEGVSAGKASPDELKDFSQEVVEEW